MSDKNLGNEVAVFAERVEELEMHRLDHKETLVRLRGALDQHVNAIEDCLTRIRKLEMLVEILIVQLGGAILDEEE